MRIWHYGTIRPQNHRVVRIIDIVCLIVAFRRTGKIIHNVTE